MTTLGTESILERIRPQFVELAAGGNLLNADVLVLGKPLTPDEAIGTPGRRDFPILIGKERVLEATVLGARGQAFTDSPREFSGSLKQVLDFELGTNQNRAIYIATLNAVLRHLGLVEGTVHCRDDEPEQCAREIASILLDRHGRVEVGLIGLNPAIAERLVDTFAAAHVRITDLFRDNIGTQRFGVTVWDGSTRTEDLVIASDLLVVTGTTLVNDTFGSILELIEAHGKAFTLYGMTAAGVAHLAGIDRLCPYGRTG
jgi:uncharacterized protein (DUF4213/DUF364 family)